MHFKFAFEVKKKTVFLRKIEFFKKSQKSIRLLNEKFKNNPIFTLLFLSALKQQKVLKQPNNKYINT